MDNTATKLTNDELGTLVTKAHAFSNANHHIRFGQALFNELHSTHPDLANEVRATGLDPFYARESEDQRVIKFFAYISEEG